jgi:hypothetical protein
MKLNDSIVAGIRTFVPWLVGVLIAQLLLLGIDVPQILEGLAGIGISVDLGTIVTTITGIVTMAYYSLAKWAEKKWPQVGWLLGYAASPTYTK